MTVTDLCTPDSLSCVGCSQNVYKMHDMLDKMYNDCAWHVNHCSAELERMKVSTMLCRPPMGSQALPPDSSPQQLHTTSIEPRKEHGGVLTEESLKGQNFGFPLLPHLRRCAPFFRATMAWIIRGRTNPSKSDHILGSSYPGIMESTDASKSDQFWGKQRMVKQKYCKKHFRPCNNP